MLGTQRRLRTTRLARSIATSSWTVTKKHFFSVDEKYEGKGTNQRVLGHVAKARGGEMLRALRRCKDSKGGRRMHSLDLLCDVVDGDGEPLGFMR